MKIEEPRIYVACLAAYNNGYLHGVWIDACQELDAIRGEVSKMLHASPVNDAEEYAIHDYERFHGLKVSEHSGLNEIQELASFVAEFGKLGSELLTYYGSLDDARTAMQDRYAGEYISLADFAQELTESSIEIPGSLKNYIDYDRMAQDMAVSDIMVIETGFEQIHVFWSI